MTRLFLTPERLSSKEIKITDEEARYLISVLRSKPGDMLTVLDGPGKKKHLCRISFIGKKEVIAEKIIEEPFSSESPLSITLAQGIPKGSKMDIIIQKTTELGVSRIIPLITRYSQVRRTGKRDRWMKIALQASRQSGREKIPEVLEPVGLDDFIEQINPTAIPSGGFKGLILSEDEKVINLKKVLKGLQRTGEIVILIGPEGGFSDDELKSALQKGFISASLGPRILRTETAPIAAVSIIQYELGDIGN
jgi:16S rRNA (uracil1498-N3)-methyltransferase